MDRERTGDRDASPASLSAWHHAVSSQVAGGASTLAFYPLDLLKTRYMAQDRTAARQHNGVRYHGIVDAARRIAAEEGPTALFRGAQVAVVASSVSWGLYMYTYRAVERALQATTDRDSVRSSMALPIAPSLCASAVGNVLVAVVMNPVWLLKNRMQLEEARFVPAGIGATTPRKYGGVVAGLQRAVQRDGVASLWRGTSAQLLVGIPNSVMFPLYDASTRWMRATQGRDALTTAEVCACSVFTKTVAGVLCHPFNVLKVRLQDERRGSHPTIKYDSLARTASLVVRHEGARGFFRGLVPGLLQTVPRGVAQFAIYERMMASYGEDVAAMRRKAA